MHTELIKPFICSDLVFDDSGLVDEDRLDRDIIMETVATGGHTLDLVDHVSAFDNLAEDCVAPALRGFAGKIQKAVVLDVNEELR